jgi:hypothetical protein
LAPSLKRRISVKTKAAANLPLRAQEGPSEKGEKRETANDAVSGWTSDQGGQ